MSLLNNMAVPCQLLINSTVQDGEGGRVSTWQVTAEFNAAIHSLESAETTEGEKQTTNDTYTITMVSNVLVPYHSVIRRVEDGATFRVISSGQFAPRPCSFWLVNYTAERWEIDG